MDTTMRAIGRRYARAHGISSLAGSAEVYNFGPFPRGTQVLGIDYGLNLQVSTAAAALRFYVRASNIFVPRGTTLANFLTIGIPIHNPQQDVAWSTGVPIIIKDAATAGPGYYSGFLAGFYEAEDNFPYISVLAEETSAGAGVWGYIQPVVAWRFDQRD